MSSLFDIFKKKEQRSKSRVEEELLRIQSQMVNTDPSKKGKKYDLSNVIKNQDSLEDNERSNKCDLEPKVTVMNVPDRKDGKEQIFQRNKEELVQRSQFAKLHKQKNKSEAFEKTMKKGLDLYKKNQESLFDINYAKEERDKLSYSIFFETVNQLENQKKLMRELQQKKLEIKETVLNGIGKGLKPVNQEQVQIIIEEYEKSNRRINELEDIIEDLKLKNTKLETRNSFLTTDNESLTKEKNQLIQNCKQLENNYKGAKAVLEKIVRQNEELKLMNNHETLKLQLDNQSLQQKIEAFKEQMNYLKQDNEKMQQKCRSLLEQINENKKNKTAKVNQKKQRLRLKYEREQQERQSVYAVTTQSAIFLTLAEFLETKDYFYLSSMNKRFNNTLRQQIGSKAMLYFFQLYLIHRQPFYTVNFLGNGSGVVGNRLMMHSQQNQLLDISHYGQEVIVAGGGGSSHGDDINSVMNNSILQQSIDRFNLPPVTQAGYEKYQNNEKVKLCIKKYVCDDYKAGSQSEKLLKKAEELIYSYSKVIYTEAQLEQMKFEFLKNNGMLSNDSIIGGPSGQRQSIAQGFGSFFTNIFSTNSNNKSGSNDRGSIAIKSNGNPSSTYDKSHMQEGANSSFQIEEQLNLSVALDNHNLSATDLMIEGFFAKFNSPQDVYKFLVDVGTLLVQEREKISQLFKKIQISFADLFYHSRLLYKECQELELLKDFFKVRVQFLKQKLQIQEKDKEELEKCYIRERDLKDKQIQKSNQLEKRLMEMQAELILHRERTEKYEIEKKSIERQYKDLEYKFLDTKEQQEKEISLIKENLEISEKEKKYIKKVLKAYAIHLSNVVDNYNN